MMTLLFSFILAMLVMSAGLWAVTKLCLRLNARLEHWSALWAVALVLCVVIPLLGLSVQFLPELKWFAEAEALTQSLPLIPLSLDMIEPVMGAASVEPSVLDWGLKGLVVSYVIGVVLRTLAIMIGRWQLTRIVRAARPYEAPDIFISASVQSAFAWTPLGRPSQSRIILPTLYVKEMSARELEDIIRHERQHLIRRDDELGLILRLLICACWISPFAHSLFARWGQAIELQCDMAVTEGRSPEMRKAYAETLITALHIVAGRVRQYPAASFSTHRLRNEKMRIANIMAGTRPAFKRGRDRLMLSAVAACATLAGTLGVAATAQAEMPTAKATNGVSSSIVNGRLTAKFGQSFDPFKEGKMRDHWGVDIAAPFGTPIYAPASGTVLAATDLYDGKPAYGTVVVLQTDDGVRTLFSHLQGYTVEAGDQVSKGQQIATVGSTGKSTGPHVHIETYRGDTRVDPMTVWDLSVE